MSAPKRADTTITTMSGALAETTQKWISTCSEFARANQIKRPAANPVAIIHASLFCVPRFDPDDAVLMVSSPRLVVDHRTVI